MENVTLGNITEDNTGAPGHTELESVFHYTYIKLLNTHRRTCIVAYEVILITFKSTLLLKENCMKIRQYLTVRILHSKE